MTRTIALPLIALMLAAPLAAQQSVQDFQLPPAPTPTASPNVQGPVDPEAPVPAAPRVIRPTATPTPAPIATPTATPSPSPVPIPSPTPTSRETNQPADRTIRTPAPSLAPTSQPSPQVETVPGTPVELPAPPEGLAPQPAATPDMPATPAPGEESGWLAWLGGGLALLVLAGLGWFFRRRRDVQAEPPAIEPPLVRQADASPAEPEPVEEPPVEQEPKSDPIVTAPDTTSGKLDFEAEVVKLSRSMVYARLSYLLHVTNGADHAVEHVEIAGDLIGASNGTPVANQVADTSTLLESRHVIERLAPGETQVIKGELALPLANVQPIMQGRTPLLVPLMRWRVSAEGAGEAVQTHVVGVKPGTPGGRLQPFRLDIPPQTFDRIGNRAVA